MTLVRVKDLLGPMVGIKDAPALVDVDLVTGRVSGGSYERLDAFFAASECAAGSGPLEHALKKFYSFMREAREVHRLPYDEAARRWNAQCDAVAGPRQAAERERQAAVKRAMDERDRAKGGKSADELFDYGRSVGIFDAPPL